jgi:hypothetical protein
MNTVTHYARENWGISECGIDLFAHIIKTTNRKARVTCKRCLRRLSSPRRDG